MHTSAAHPARSQNNGFMRLTQKWFNKHYSRSERAALLSGYRDALDRVVMIVPSILPSQTYNNEEDFASPTR